MENHWFDDALLVNRDPNWYTALAYDSPETAEASIRQYFQAFTGYALTDVQLCVYENSSIIPSDVMTWRGEKFLWTEENGEAVSYSQLEGLYRIWHDFGLDPVQIFIDTMKETGIRPWITMRMNDAHFGCEKTSFLRDRFFYTARQNGWMLGDEYGYYAWCLDYSVPEVRQRMLDFIREVLSKYAPYGLELDFMREIFSFPYKNCPEKVQILTQFLRDVKKILAEAEKRHGQSIRLMIRVHRSVEENLSFGFDVAGWIREGLADALVPSPRWECTDDAIPVRQWKALAGENVAVFPCVETLHLEHTNIVPEITKGYAAAWNAQKADGLYLYNHDYPEVERYRDSYVLRRHTAEKGLRRYIVTYQDIVSGDWPRCKPLPLDLTQQNVLALDVGTISAEDRVEILLDVESSGSWAVSVPGAEMTEPEPASPVTGICAFDGKETVISGENTVLCRLHGFMTDGKMDLQFSGTGVLRYVEIRIHANE